MSAKFAFVPPLNDVAKRLQDILPSDKLSEVVALLVKRDRELEDYVNALEGRCTAAEARLTAGGL